MADKETKNQSDEYDPYKERKAKNPTNDIESMVHIIKGILGTGILAMPEAFKNSGMLLGFVGSILNGSLCTYGIHIFVQCIYMLCKRNRLSVLTYTEAMRLGFSQGPEWARKTHNGVAILTDTFIVFYQVGICCVYTLFVIVNMKSVVDVFTKRDISLQFYLMMLTVPFLLINSLRNLKMLAPFSFVANGITLFTIGAVFYYIFATPLPPISERPLIANLKRFPLFFGITSFAFTSVAVSIAVENNMKNPKHFGGLFGVYNISVALLMTLYILFFPTQSVLTQVVNSLYAVAIYISFGLNGYVPIQLIWETYLEKKIADSHWPLAWEYFLRILVVTVSFFFAASIPMLGLFMSVFGAISISHLGFIFPAILDICVRYPDNYGRCKIYKWRDIFMAVYGVIGLITGAGVGIREIVLEFIKKAKE